MSTRYYVADFETTVYEGQTDTEVWASAIVPFGSENVEIHHSIGETFEYFRGLKHNAVVYYHNLKFDGSFWMNFLLRQTVWRQGIDTSSGMERMKPRKELEEGEYAYSISDRGQWYSITIMFSKHWIEIRDSLKLLPFSVERIGKAFKTQHQKLTMEYTGFRYAGCEITPEEREYIANDVLVVKEALELMISKGHKRPTIGSCCLSEYKKLIGNQRYDDLFPSLTNYELEPGYGADNADAYIRNAYRGGWCIVAPGKEQRVFKNGCTFDVNSLYPSMMHSISGNYFPVGRPSFFRGAPSKMVTSGEYYYFIRFTCAFDVKPGMLPFVQIKRNYLYQPNENLLTSRIKYQGKYYDSVQDSEGNTYNSRVELTMSGVDFELFQKHYYIHDIEYLDGCYFDTAKGLFDRYIDKYMEIKMHSEGAERELAKLFLNNLYGKLASNTDSSYKICYLKDGVLKYRVVKEHNKQAGHIACGSAITSYARRFTITAAQLNYHGPDEPGFIYADTDSIHVDLPASEVKGITEHPTKLCCWKKELEWKEAIFTRQKTYIEVSNENGADKYLIKCAGMQKDSKDLLAARLQGDAGAEIGNKQENYKYYLTGPKLELTDFKPGLQVLGKLRPKQVPGGILLIDDCYTMKG